MTDKSPAPVKAVQSRLIASQGDVLQHQCACGNYATNGEFGYRHLLSPNSQTDPEKLPLTDFFGVTSTFHF